MASVGNKPISIDGSTMPLLNPHIMKDEMVKKWREMQTQTSNFMK